METNSGNQSGASLVGNRNIAPRPAKILFSLSILWFALDACFMIIGSVGFTALAPIGIFVLVFSYVGIPILLIIAGFFMAFGTKSEKKESQPTGSGNQKFNLWEVVIASVIFLLGIILPMILGSNYNATHPASVSPPEYIAQIGFWINATAFLFALALLRRQSLKMRIAAIILIVLSGLYFCILLIGFMLSGFIG